MFNIDERLKGLPAVKEQVVQLYQSLNQPHLAIPGRKAGPAASFVLGLRGPSGFAVFVYLYLQDSGECAVYVPSGGTVAADAYQGEESEALGFVESMGFIMDNLNFRGRAAEEQELMIKTLPVCQRAPPPPSPHQDLSADPKKPGTGGKSAVVNLGKLFSAFCLALALAGCAHVPSPKDREQSRLHYELAVQSFATNAQGAYAEAEEALRLDSTNAEAWHVKALVLHLSFKKLEDARLAYEKAVTLKDPFSEAHTNFGNLYLDMKRYDDAIKQYEVALNDVLYREPFIAHGNMGWAYFKKGEAPYAVNHLKAATTLNPTYCMGYLQLGQVLEAQDNMDGACQAYGNYRSSCPEQADAYQREGVCQARQGDREAAALSFDTCVTKSKLPGEKDQCRKLKEQLAP